MSLRHNLLANYASQIYVTIVGIVMVPLYMNYMGAEAYGLVGFFSMLQSWFNLLDVGLTPTMARETARFNGGSVDALSYRRLARVLEGLFAGVAIVGGLVLFFASDYLAKHWLNLSQLTLDETTQVLRLVAIVVALRWVSGFYRGVISGFERLVWLSSFNTLIATLRFVLVMPILIFISATPLVFFNYQLIVAVIELVGLSLFSYRLLPKIPKGYRIDMHWSAIKPVMKFSLSIAFTGSVWVMVTQTDKLILSKILPLAEYGYFTVAVLVATGISVLCNPVSGSILPRMARLQAEGQHAQLLEVYRQATQLVVVITIPVALVMSFFAEQVLWAWTGSASLIEKAAPVLRLYAAGYGVLSVSAFPYYLQYAKGDLKLHLIGNVLFVILLIPSVIWATIYHGLVGAGWAWVIANVIYFILWVPLVHKRFDFRLHSLWLKKDIVRVISTPILVIIIVKYLVTWTSDRLVVGLELVGIYVMLFVLACLGASLRDKAWSIVRYWWKN